MRIDKFLKVSRLIKRRAVANEACDAGRVLINGKVYMVASKEENTNSIEINNVVTHILSTLTERGA